MGVSFVSTAEAAGRRGLLNAATGGRGLLHAFVGEERLIVLHATAHANMIAAARRQAARAIQVRATRHVLRVEARGRAQVASTSHALHNVLLNYIASMTLMGCTLVFY